MGILKSASAFFFNKSFFIIIIFNSIVFPHLGVPDTSDLRVFDTFGLYTIATILANSVRIL